MSQTVHDLNAVVGKGVFRAWRGYQHAIFFEIGKQVSPGKGEYSVCLDFCPWRICIDDIQIISSNSPFWIMDDIIAKSVGRICTGIILDTERMRTTLTFTEGFVVETSHVGEKDTWYLCTPDQVVIVGQNCAISTEANAE